VCAISHGMSMVIDEKGHMEAVLIFLHCYCFWIDPNNACRVVIDVSSYSLLRMVNLCTKRADAWTGGWMQKSTPSLIWRMMCSSTLVGLVIRRQTFGLWVRII